MQATDAECPLCMEQLEIDDVNFFPCTCGYQICRFCWHRIRTDENGLCPACRKPYSEDPAIYTPLSQEEIQRILKERKQKDVQRKQKVTENRKHLANVRVVQKNLVFVVGLTQRLADPELLKRPEYFSKFGKIHKIVVNSSTNYAGPQGPSASAYITYIKEEDAIKAIVAVCNTHLDGRMLKASLGTTKYCSYFLRNIPCPKTDCMYLHELGDGAGSFTKEEMQAGKHQEYEQQLISFYSKKIGLNSDQDSKDIWPVERSSENRASPSLVSGAAWAGKSENNDNKTQPVMENKDNSIPQCKENWEESLNPPSTVSDHVPQTTVTQQAPKPPTQTTCANTGWGNTENARPLDTPSLFGPDLCSSLGLANLHLKVFEDDDLGFDPFKECREGLEDLLKEENQAPKPGLTSLQSHSIPSPFGSGPDNIRDWQDGLRALLPNINISFSDSLLAQQNSWLSSSSSPSTQNPSSNWPYSTQSSSPQVRPPPGFECKQPPNHMSGIDDPSILWSKTLDPANTSQINKATRKPVPNGFPGMHNLPRSTNLRSSTAVPSTERVATSLNDDSPQERCSNTNKNSCELDKHKGNDVSVSEKLSRENTEDVQRADNLKEQRKTRVSELSLIDVNEPPPTKRVHSPLDCIKENKNMSGKIQKTKTRRGQVEESIVKDRRQQQDSYSKIGKKLRRTKVDDKTNPRWS